MTTINAAVTPMEEVEIFGMPALFTPHKVSRATVHWGLQCYEIQAMGKTLHRPFLLMEHAERDFYGTVLTPIPITLPPDGGKAILPGDFLYDLQEGFYTPAEFDEKYMSPEYDMEHFSERYGK